jgi:hypothetical protein
MTNNPEGKLGQRTVKNSFTKRMIENTCNTEENTKNISEMNNQNTMQIPVQNYQETQRNLNEENNNLKPVPVLILIIKCLHLQFKCNPNQYQMS